MADPITLQAIATAFARSFAHWQLTLPERNLDLREPGTIHDRGWLIQYRFGRDADGEYLDYYAAHRMTNDSHVRLHADGRRTRLEAYADCFVVDPDPARADLAREEFEAHNQRVRRALAEKGFGGETVNMAMHAGIDAPARQNRDEPSV